MSFFRPIIWGPRPFESWSEAKQYSAQELLNRSGNNLGNFVFMYAVTKIFQPTGFSFLTSIADLPRVEHEYDVLIIPAANWLWPGWDWSWLLELLRRTRIPIVVMGLGCQWPSPETFGELTLPRDTVDLVRLFAERSSLLGVRGKYTAELLERLGIRNFQIIGCPSFYVRPSASELYGEPLQASGELAVSLSRPVARHSMDPEAMREAESVLATFGLNSKAIYLIQAEPEELALALAKNPSAELFEKVANVCSMYYRGVSASDFAGWVSQRGMPLLHIPSVVNILRHVKLVFGTRIHTSLLAIMAGCRVCQVCHDLRTLELADFLQIPYVTLKEWMLEGFKIEALEEKANQPNETWVNELVIRFQSFLNNNGLECAASYIGEYWDALYDSA